MEGLLDGGLSVEREPGVDLGGDLAWDDLENLLTELDEEVVKGVVDLVVKVLAVLLAVLNRSVDKRSILWLLRGCENEGWVGGGILWLVLLNGGEVTGVADDNLKMRSVALLHRQ